MKLWSKTVIKVNSVLKKGIINFQIKSEGRKNYENVFNDLGVFREIRSQSLSLTGNPTTGFFII